MAINSMMNNQTLLQTTGKSWEDKYTKFSKIKTNTIKILALTMATITTNRLNDLVPIT